MTGRRLVVGLWGTEKAGKTSFGLSAPRPIHFFNLDWGVDRVLDNFTDGLTFRDASTPGQRTRVWTDADGVPVITVHDFPRRLVGSLDERYGVSTTLLNAFFATYQATIDRAATGTIVVDTMTEVDDLVQITTLESVRVHKYKGKTDAADFQPVPFDYGHRNEIIRSVYLAPYAKPGLNAVFVHKAKDKYIGKDKVEGVVELAGWKGAPSEVDVMVQCLRQPGISGPGAFMGHLSACGIDYTLENTPLARPNFTYLADVLGTS